MQRQEDFQELCNYLSLADFFTTNTYQAQCSATESVYVDLDPMFYQKRIYPSVGFICFWQRFSPYGCSRCVQNPELFAWFCICKLRIFLFIVKSIMVDFDGFIRRFSPFSGLVCMNSDTLSACFPIVNIIMSSAYPWVQTLLLFTSTYRLSYLLFLFCPNTFILRQKIRVRCISDILSTLTCPIREPIHLKLL